MKYRNLIPLAGFVTAWLAHTLPALAEAQASAPIQISPAFTPKGQENDQNVFLEGEPVTIRLQLDDPKGTLRDQSVQWTVSDLDRNICDEGTATAQVEDNQAIIELTELPDMIGWYLIELAKDGVNFTYAANAPEGLDRGAFISYAVVPVPDTGDNHYFGLDVGYSTSRLVPPTSLIRLSARMGAHWIRDRFSPRVAWPKDETWNFERYRNYGELARSYGLSVMEVFHSFPFRYLETPTDHFPGDLMSVYRCFRQSGEELDGVVSAWEIWNEQDIAHFGDRPPDYYAAFVKAAALGFKDSGMKAQCLLGPFARDPNVDNYAEILFSNGVSDYLDGYSFHTYAPVDTGIFELVLNTNLQLAAKAGFSPSQVWLTETGQAFSRREIPDFFEAAYQNAAYVPQAMATALSLDLAHTFVFMLRPHVGSGPSQFGLLRLDGTPFPALLTYSVTTHYLGQDAHYVGQLRGQSITALVFATPQGETTVAWTPGAPRRLSLPRGHDWQAVDALGRDVALTYEGADSVSVELTNLPVFLTGGEWPQDDITPSTPPPPAPSEDDEARLRPVVLQLRLPREYIEQDDGTPKENWDGLASLWAPRGYTAPATAALELPVRIYNFSESEVTGTITLKSPGSPIQLSDPVSIPAMSHVDHTWSLEPPAGAPQTDMIRMEGHFNQQPISPYEFRLKWE